MTINEIIFKEFIIFLKEKEAYANFKYNINKKFDWNQNSIKNYIKEIQPINFLLCAFYWKATKQGEPFWNKLDKEWVYYGYSHKLF